MIIRSNYKVTKVTNRGISDVAYVLPFTLYCKNPILWPILTLSALLFAQMISAVILGTMAGLLTAVIIIAAAVAVTRYQKAKKLQEAKDRIRNGFYIKDINDWSSISHKQRVRKTGFMFSNESESRDTAGYLCKGTVYALVTDVEIQQAIYVKV